MSFECSIYQKLITEKWNLNRHHKNVHQQKERKAEEKIPEKAKVSFECGICQKLFTEKSNLIRHHKNVHQQKKRKVEEEIQNDRGGTIGCVIPRFLSQINSASVSFGHL